MASSQRGCSGLGIRRYAPYQPTTRSKRSAAEAAQGALQSPPSHGTAIAYDIASAWFRLPPALIRELAKNGAKDYQLLASMNASDFDALVARVGSEY